MIYVVFPAYNEGDAVPRLIRRIATTLDLHDLPHRVIVVDDASTDGTWHSVRILEHTHALTVLRNDENQGYGGALEKGLLNALARANDRDLIVTMDGDDTHPPELIPGMLAAVEQGATVVIASRYAPGAVTLGYSARRRLASRVGNLLYRLTAHLDDVSDYTNGYRAYPAGFLAAALRARSGRLFEARDFSAATELLLNLAELPGARVRELAFTYRYDRKSAASKLRLRATARRHLRLLSSRFRLKTLRAESPG